MAIKLLSSTKIGNFTLPHTDGTGGQALVTDGNGNISFAHTGGVTGLSFTSGVLTATRAAGNITVNLDGRYALTSHNHSGVYDNYQSWNLKTNGVQRTTVQSGGTLDLVAGSNVTLSYGAGGVVTIAAASSTETDTLATVTGRGASTNTPVTFNGNVTLGNSADLVFQDLAGTFPTSGKGFDWTLNNDGARIYAVQPSSDSIDLVFQLRDNATTNDRFVFWVDDYQGAAFDKYPLIIRGGTEFDLVDSGLFVRGTQVITNGRNLQNVTGNISMFTNDSGYITGSGSTSGNAGSATVLQTARTINGTSFNGSANITTASWGTARTITIGSTGKSVDGSGNISWTLAEIGAQAAGSYAAASHTHVWTDITNRPTTVSSFTNDSGYITSSGSISGYSTNLISQDIRTLSPSSHSAYRLNFGFTSWANNNSSPYADYLHLRSYSDSSGGSDNLIMFKKSGIGMRIWQQAFGSTTAYATYADVWTSNDFTSSNVTNWNTAYGWGNHASAGYLTSASLSGYATQAYVNTAVANVVNSAPAALDTLNELATALGNDASFSTTVSTALGNRLRVDTAAQGLTGTQQSNARTNLGLGTAATSNTGDFASSGHSHSNATTGAAGFMSAADKSKLDGIASGATANTGTVTSVSGTGSVNGITLSGTVTSSGSLTLGGSISIGIDNITDEPRVFNNMGQNHSTQTDFNLVSDFGFRYVQGNTNGPGTGSSQFYGMSLGLGNDYAFSQYAMQLAIPRYNGSDKYISFRTREAGTWGSWTKVSAGYADTANALSSMNISQFTNNSGYITGINSSMVTTALGYTPYNSSNPSGYITGITSSMVTSALGFTPYNSTNPNGYITSSGSISGNAATATSASLMSSSGAFTTQHGDGRIGYTYALTNPQTGLFPASDNANAILTVNRHPGNYYSQLGFSSNGNLYYRNFVNTAINTSQGWQTIWTSSSLTNLNQLSNGPGYTSNTGTVTSVSGTGTVSGLTLSGTVTTSGSLTLGGTLTLTSGQVTTALGYTPYNSSNPNGYITSSGSVAQLSGWSLQNIVPYHSGSDFPNGTLVVTNINASVTSGDSFVMEVTGKSYQTGNSPFSLILQGYIYADTFINCSAMNNGTTFPNVVILNYGGNLAFWWPRISYWNSFSVTVREAGGSSSNRVTSISDSTEPSSSKKVTVTPINVIHSNNIGSQSVNYASSAGSVAWSNVSGRPTTVSSFTNDSGYITSGGRAYPRRSDGGDLNFYWSGQSGQPTWLWGGTDGTNMYVYNPSNFSVNYATTAGSAPANGGNSNTVAGLSVHSARNNEANKIVRTDANGYIQAGWINTPSGAFGSAINKIYCSDDDYVRYQTPANFISNLGLITTSNISSQSVNYASSAGGVSWGNVSSRPDWLAGGSYIGSHSNANDWKNSGFYENGGGGSNWPSATWYNSINVRHSNQGNYHGFQVAMSYYDNLLWFRSYQGSGTFQSWAYAISSANIGSQSVNYASSAGNADTVDGYHMNQAVTVGASPTFTEVYANNWFRNNEANEGLYNQVTTQHWSSRDNGYWDASSTTSVSGIRFYTGGHVNSLRGYVYADSSNNIGFLNSGGNWSLRCDNSGNVVATGDVTAYSDARIKTEVKTVEDALDKVLALRGVTYKRTDTEDKSTKIGVIAQEVKEVLPEVVSENEDGMLTVSYGNMVGVLIEAMKEQQAMIETLEAKIELLTRYLK